MLIVSNTSRRENRRRIASALRCELVPIRLVVRKSEPTLESVPWSTFWRPCKPFFGADTRLVHRLNRFKSAWRKVLRAPKNRQHQLAYCWRYFGLLHASLELARREPQRGDPLPVLRRILGFATFTTELEGEHGKAAGTSSWMNPVYQLGRLSTKPPPPTPRHVPFVVPPGENQLYYCYRQLLVDKESGETVLVFPSAGLEERRGSFASIDRLTRLVSAKPDPYWKPRSCLLARRALSPLFRASMRNHRTREKPCRLSILDLGAGTGHLSMRSWRSLRGFVHMSPRLRASLHLVDSTEPSFGRSYGISHAADDISHVEWTRADYRRLLDNDEWLKRNAPFDWVFACRLFDNMSNFVFERTEDSQLRPSDEVYECGPHQCLAPRRQSSGTGYLAVRTVRRTIQGGMVMPQHSLSDYFRAAQAVLTSNNGVIATEAPYLPVRRFNPAALTTASGRSILAQLMKVASAIVIEDLDLEPEHLKAHQEQFGLGDTGGVHFVRDGFTTEAQYFVVTSPSVAEHLPGDRLW